MTHQVLSLVHQKQFRNSFSSSQSLDDFETTGKNSRNQHSQKSLLTQALRVSSQKSNTDAFEQQYLSQVVLRPRFQDYSLAENSIVENQLKMFSLRSVKSTGNGKQKILTDFVEETKDENKENKFTIRRKEIRLKREQSSCSRCEIF